MCLSKVDRRSQRHSTPSSHQLQSGWLQRLPPMLQTTLHVTGSLFWWRVPQIFLGSAADRSAYSLTLAIHTVITDSAAAMLTECTARWSWVSSAYWRYRTPCQPLGLGCSRWRTVSNLKAFQLPALLMTTDGGQASRTVSNFKMGLNRCVWNGAVFQPFQTHPTLPAAAAVMSCDRLCRSCKQVESDHTDLLLVRRCVVLSRTSSSAVSVECSPLRRHIRMWWVVGAG